jgi:hypothetical protein
VCRGFALFFPNIGFLPWILYTVHIAL